MKNPTTNHAENVLRRLLNGERPILDVSPWSDFDGTSGFEITDVDFNATEISADEYAYLITLTNRK